MADDSADGLSAGETALLIDGLSDDVSFEWALVHLGIRGNPASNDEPPGPTDIAMAFASFDRLVALDLVSLGRIEYVDPRQPEGTSAPVRHVAEPIAVVRQRVEQACRDANVPADWAFSCWIVNTGAGDEAARFAIERDA
jgi:hypothetical protein